MGAAEGVNIPFKLMTSRILTSLSVQGSVFVYLMSIRVLCEGGESCGATAERVVFGVDVLRKVFCCAGLGAGLTFAAPALLAVVGH